MDPTRDASEPDGMLVANTAVEVMRVEDLHKYYELGEARVHALRGIHVTIGRGEFVAIMGASGSGKSTFMNILGCLDRPSSGRYFLEGIDVSQHDKKALALIRNQRLGFQSSLSDNCAGEHRTAHPLHEND